jgi:hypothetical protein
LGGARALPNMPEESEKRNITNARSEKTCKKE